MIKDLALYVLALLVAFLALLGATALSVDARAFGAIEQRCRDHGFIQNTSVRIYCQVEVRP